MRGALRCERELHYDVLVAPTLSCELPLVEEEETPEYRARVTANVRPFNWLGWPSATTRDGVLFSGRSDATVLAAALAWEQRAAARRRPAERHCSGFVPAIQMITRVNFPSASKSKKLQLCMSFFEPSLSSPK